jgi:hypothetical protein
MMFGEQLQVHPVHFSCKCACSIYALLMRPVSQYVVARQQAGNICFVFEHEYEEHEEHVASVCALAIQPQFQVVLL